MLTLLGRRTSGQHCDGVTRRDFLRVGALGMGGLCLPDLLRARAAGSGQGTGKQTSVVFLWLEGGAPQTETFDAKPGISEDFRSVVGEVRTRLPGVHFGGLMQKMAGLAPKMSIIRTLTHGDANHPGATHWVRTGYPVPAGMSGDGTTRPERPSIGSIVARLRGATHPRTGVPTYIRTIAQDFRGYKFARMWGPGWLGDSYDSFSADDKGALENFTLQLPEARFRDRKELVKALDSLKRTLERSRALDTMDTVRQQAYTVLAGQGVKDAFDLTREDLKTRERYGPLLGEKLLLARRLCEAGAGFVAVNYSDWDMHGNFGSMTGTLKRMCPPTDHAVAAFIEDIYARGLDRNILLVVGGEFGRSPKISGQVGGKSFGREHWPELSSVVLVGGGLKMGQAVGESTARAERPKTRPVSPQDLAATLFHVLGIDQDLQFTHPTGRPVTMIEEGKVISELV
jgi:uncharacterized protein (DUF1501 family)